MQGRCDFFVTHPAGNIFGDTPGNNTTPYAIYLSSGVKNFAYFVKDPNSSQFGIGDFLFDNIKSNQNVIYECKDFEINNLPYCGNGIIDIF